MLLITPFICFINSYICLFVSGLKFLNQKQLSPNKLNILHLFAPFEASMEQWDLGIE